MRSGLEAVERLMKSGKIKGVYGPIIDLMQNYDDFHEFFKAVETTAGNRLFYVVVRDDNVGAQLLETLHATNSGRVTVMPLNRLRLQDIAYPESNDTFPMIDRLQFDEKFRPAFQQIFGKTLICRDIHLAAQFSRKHNFDTITLDGDQINSKGAIRGGWIDSRRSRLRTRFMMQVMSVAFRD